MDEQIDGQLVKLGFPLRRLVQSLAKAPVSEVVEQQQPALMPR